jgi:hypothetical protein
MKKNERIRFGLIYSEVPAAAMGGDDYVTKLFSSNV